MKQKWQWRKIRFPRPVVYEPSKCTNYTVIASQWKGHFGRALSGESCQSVILSWCALLREDDCLDSPHSVLFIWMLVQNTSFHDGGALSQSLPQLGYLCKKKSIYPPITRLWLLFLTLETGNAWSIFEEVLYRGHSPCSVWLSKCWLESLKGNFPLSCYYATFLTEKCSRMNLSPVCSL